MPTIEELDWWHEYDKVLLNQLALARELARYDPASAAWARHAAMYEQLNCKLKKDNSVSYPDVVARLPLTTCPLREKLSRYVCPQRRRWSSSQKPKP